ncbi:hypothetical protein NDU88_003966 [Pleurodeles waltl]|uniref:Uncharacterized protein n=1 Tax=Pleurodeles waltl TaxID=8319 RepID=A0AAV7QGD0_PLEWA|nr:hypothetical protein NDU88_003966 [Pleurodeles waltl]
MENPGCAGQSHKRCIDPVWRCVEFSVAQQALCRFFMQEVGLRHAGLAVHRSARNILPKGGLPPAVSVEWEPVLGSGTARPRLTQSYFYFDFGRSARELTGVPFLLQGLCRSTRVSSVGQRVP